MTQKSRNEPHVPINKQQFKRCEAKSKRTGDPCQQPAMPNGRCRLHGGHSTGPKTPAGLKRSQMANWKHGMYSQEAKELWADVRELLADQKELERRMFIERI